ncbi:MAG: hypothetical protein E6R13_08300 [Spirochaetes bacterium]|nr:MAG: hypothetical protein E6R13_08300 [Spirochaetota bacterium]
MMKRKLKKCDGCGEDTYIWANREGKKLCKQCSNNTGVAKLSIKPTAKSTFIAPRSQKRSKEERLYLAKRIIFLQEHNMCEAHLPGICTKYSTEIHHKAGRIGELLIDESKWLSVCRACHEFIETHPVEAQEKGFSLKRIT